MRDWYEENKEALSPDYELITKGVAVARLAERGNTKESDAPAPGLLDSALVLWDVCCEKVSKDINNVYYCNRHKAGSSHLMGRNSVSQRSSGGSPQTSADLAAPGFTTPVRCSNTTQVPSDVSRAFARAMAMAGVTPGRMQTVASCLQPHLRALAW